MGKPMVGERKHNLPAIQSRGTDRAILLYCNTMYNDLLVYLHLIDTTDAHQIAKHNSSKFNCN
jgi:hypothetical protein